MEAEKMCFLRQENLSYNIDELYFNKLSIVNKILLRILMVTYHNKNSKNKINNVYLINVIRFLNKQQKQYLVDYVNSHPQINFVFIEDDEGIPQ